jgi:hypothetical protein
MAVTQVRCPECGSTAVRKREVVFKTGTSYYSGRSSSVGFSFPLSKRGSLRGWTGGGSHSGKRQSATAQEASRLPFWPAIIVLAAVYLFGGGQSNFGMWSMLGVIFSVLWLIVAIKDLLDYPRDWLCSKCGIRFQLIDQSSEDLLETNPETIIEAPAMMSRNSNTSESGKLCSICGVFHPHSEFEYGNRSNRSYCQRCNRDEKAAYSEGGTEAAREYRESKRASWQKL